MSTRHVSVVIPTHNGARTLAACLESLRASSHPPHEIVVVDDASQDDSGEIARRFGCRIVRVDQNIGAARAKNLGAKQASGEILFFTDDDVLVSPTAVEQVACALDDPKVDGVVGLLDANIPFRDFASNYKNLWMRYTYTRLPQQRIGVFYTSVAAIRREVFLRLGGFDENYSGASIAEDTEFGQRVWDAGFALALDAGVSVVHCKRYTARQVLVTDYARARALMLMRLRKWGRPFFTSVPTFYQLAVPVIFIALAALAGAWLHPAWLATAGILMVAFYALNAQWLGYLARERGAGFALCGALLQPFDVLAVGFGMAAAAVEFVFGVRY